VANSFWQTCDEVQRVLGWEPTLDHIHFIFSWYQRDMPAVAIAKAIHQHLEDEK
jgi:hypothetical protein